MEHLNPERLSALVDEEPTVPECIHLASCRSCTSELDALRAQSVALKALPELLPPRGDWDSLEPNFALRGSSIHSPSRIARTSVVSPGG